MKVKIKKLHQNAVIPTFAYTGDACMDLYAVESVFFKPGDIRFIRSGLAFGIPDGYYIEVRPRSGLSKNSQLIILNSPATIDFGYRGEVVVFMKSLNSDRSVVIKEGDRFAQILLKKKIEFEFEEVDELSETERGSGGFGSSGK